ncbi:MAG TPA: DUF167 domain-containing protein [Candidatus Paceibacterota bacterium]|nr:DUF167 domain-containing protein [Candidatus Paceibacterota bacterium]
MKILVRAKPGAKHAEVREIGIRSFAVAVREPAKEGKANQAIERAIAEHFNVAPSRVRIVSGQTSRGKILEIAD